MKDNTYVINLSNYVSPEIKEQYSRDYVTYDLVKDGKRLGKNSYFQYLIDRRDGSATNGAIINSITAMIHGLGVVARDRAMKPDEWAKFLSIVKDEDIKKVSDDLYHLGHGAFEIITKGKGKSLMATHMPVQMLAPEKRNKDGEIEAYYYAYDWDKVYSLKDVERIPVFKEGTTGKSILYIKPYKAGRFYFSEVDYKGCLQYAELEEEIGNYHINNIQNGLAPSMLVNFNNGVPDEEKQKQIVKKIDSKYSGSSNAGRVIVQFNDNKENAATIDAVPLSDASDQYQFLSNECSTKIITGHRVVSPLLFGLPSGSGFGSNADEIKTAYTLFEALVSTPKRKLMLEALDKLMSFMGFNLDLQYESLNPFETPKQTMKLSKDIDLDKILESYAVDAPEGYELYAVQPDISQPFEFAATANSEQDTELWKIRYAYAVGTSKTPEGASRPFCNKMMALSNAGKVFRKEDIEKMSADGVNGQFAHSGGKYDIFKYAGGVNCYHRWERRIFKKKRDENDKPLGGNALQNTFPVNVNEARSQGAKLPKNDPDVAIAEIDKPNRGSLK